jgi:hypothetical protein
MQKKLELSSSLIMGHVEDNGQEQNDVKTCQNYRDTMAKFCLSLSDDKINQTLHINSTGYLQYEIIEEEDEQSATNNCPPYRYQYEGRLQNKCM